MHYMVINFQLKSKKYIHTHKNVLSLIIGGLFYSAIPAWANSGCTVTNPQNGNNGVDMICEGADGANIIQDTMLIGGKNNNIIAKGGVYSSIYGGYSNGLGGGVESTVNGNTLILQDNSSVTSVAYGGYGASVVGADSVVSGNTIIFKDNSSATNYVYGGSSNSYGASSIANGNTVTFQDNSSMTGNVYGGHSISSQNKSFTIANENTVTLNDNSKVVGNVYGGWIYLTPSDASEAITTGNTVNINGSASVSGSLFGAYVSRDSSSGKGFYDGFTGNTLNFSANPIVLSGRVENFENYNFTVDPSLANTNTALITANTINFGSNIGNMSADNEDKASKIQVVGIKSGNELFVDDKFVLMQATNMSGNAESLNSKGVAQQGISLVYDVGTEVDIEGKQVTATIIGKSVNSRLKALSEGHLASAMMLNRGADMLAYDAINAIQYQNPEKGLVPFIVLSGGKTRYNSGSHIDAKDGFLTGGLSYQTDKLTSAVLVESGWGSYTTHNSFSDLDNVKGDGHNNYVGVAVVGRYDLGSDFYVDGSIRGGKNHNTYETKDIQNSVTDEYANYKLNSNYLGAHVGTGYSKELDEKNVVGVSAKYLWTQLKGKTVNITGDNIKFDDINSQRVRLDTGLSHQYTPAVALRAGLGYEYEFDGKANASTYGYNIPAPGVKGSTALLTLGSTFKPLANKAFSVDVNLDGYTGKRDGVSGGLQLSYAF